MGCSVLVSTGRAEAELGPCFPSPWTWGKRLRAVVSLLQTESRTRHSECKLLKQSRNISPCSLLCLWQLRGAPAPWAGLCWGEAGGAAALPVCHQAQVMWTKPALPAWHKTRSVIALSVQGWQHCPRGCKGNHCSYEKRPHLRKLGVSNLNVLLLSNLW